MFGQLTLDLDNTPLVDRIIQNDDPRVGAFLQEWRNQPFYALDIETKGVKYQSEALDPFRGQIRLIQIYYGTDVLVIDMDRELPNGFMETLKERLWNGHPVGHYIQFDLSFIKQQLGLECKSPRDTRVMSILLWCGIKYSKQNGKVSKFRHTLKDVVKRLFNTDIDKGEQTSDWSLPKLTNSQLNYAADDVIWTLKAFKQMCRMFRQENKMLAIDGQKPHLSLMEIVKTECEVIPAFVEIILTGQPIDLEYANDVKSQYQRAIEDLYRPVQERLNLPYSAQAIKLVQVFWELEDILLVKEVINPDEDTKEDLCKFKQLNLFSTKPLPDLKPNQEFSTSSSNLFYHYCQTKNDYLLRLSLARSLKKCVDSLDALIKSAEQNNGYAIGGFTSLGDTGSGRSTCSSGGKSNLIATNLQNIAKSVDHDLVKKYNLPNVRSVIRNGVEDGMWLCDLSASHLRFAVRNCQDPNLYQTLVLDDPHSLVTSQMFKLEGKKVTPEYCVANKKKDPQVGYYRNIAKTALYTQFNDGGASTFFNSLTKKFVEVTIEDCQKAQEALGETFPGYTRYTEMLKTAAKYHIVNTEYGRFVKYRTHDGRLFHVEVREREGKYGKYETFKLGEITSSMLISPEAYVMKRSQIDILDFIRNNRNEPIKLNSFCHDDLSGEDLTADKILAKFVYETIKRNFSKALGDVPSGLDKDYASILINNYSEK